MVSNLGHYHLLIFDKSFRAGFFYVEYGELQDMVNVVRLDNLKMGIEVTYNYWRKIVYKLGKLDFSRLSKLVMLQFII